MARSLRFDTPPVISSRLCKAGQRASHLPRTRRHTPPQGTTLYRASQSIRDASSAAHAAKTHSKKWCKSKTAKRPQPDSFPRLGLQSQVPPRYLKTTPSFSNHPTTPPRPLQEIKSRSPSRAELAAIRSFKRQKLHPNRAGSLPVRLPYRRLGGTKLRPFAASARDPFTFGVGVDSTTTLPVCRVVESTQELN